MWKFCLRLPYAGLFYFTTEIDQEIPGGLYQAVAQVLAYVYQLKAFNNKQGKRPTKLGSARGAG